MKNILIIHRPFDKTLSIGIRHEYIIKSIRKYYSNVYCLSYKHSYTISKKEIFTNPVKLKTIKYLFMKFFLPPKSFDLNLYLLKNQIKNHLAERNIDIVLFLVHPFYFLRLINYIKNLDPSLKIIVDMSDPYKEWVVNLNRNFVSKILMKRFENKVLKNVDTLIVLNYEIKKYYKKYAKNVVVIEQGVNQEVIEDIRKRVISRQNSNITNKKYIELVYGGKFYKGIREPFKLYEAIIGSNKPLKLKIYSQMDSTYYYPPAHEKINYKKPISQKALFNEYHHCDITIFIDNFRGIQVPGKTIELLAFSKPILFIFENDNSPSLHYVSKQPGVFLAKNNAEIISNVINNIIKSIGITYQRDLSMYFWSNLLSKYIEIINDSNE